MTSDEPITESDLKPILAHTRKTWGPTAAAGFLEGHRASMLAEPSLKTRLPPDSHDPVFKSRLGPPTPEDSSEDVSLTENTDNLAALPAEPLRNEPPHRTVNSTQRNFVRTPTSSPPVSQSRKRPMPGSSLEPQTASLESQSPLSQDPKRRRGRPPGSLNKRKSDPFRTASARDHVFLTSTTLGIGTHGSYRGSHTWRKQVRKPNKEHRHSASNEQTETGSRNIEPRLYNSNYHRLGIGFERLLHDLGTTSNIKTPLSRSYHNFEALFEKEVTPLIEEVMKEYEGKLSPKDLLTTGKAVS